MTAAFRRANTATLLALALLVIGSDASASHRTPASQATTRGDQFDADITNNSLALSPDEHLLAASNSNLPYVQIVAVGTGKITARLDGLSTPRNLLFTHDGKQLLVSDSTLGIIRIYDTGSWKPVADLAVGAGAFGTALDASGTRLYVNNEAADTVTIIDLARRRTTDVLSGFAGPRQGIRLSPDGHKVFVTNFGNDTVTVLDAATLERTGEIRDLHGIRALSVSADGKTLYAANSKDNQIAQVDAERNAMVRTVEVGKDPYGASLSPDGRILLSGDKVDNTVTIVDVPKLTVIAKIVGFNEPRQAIVFTSDGATVYVLNKDLTVSVVDLAVRTIRETLPRS